MWSSKVFIYSSIEFGYQSGNGFDVILVEYSFLAWSLFFLTLPSTKSLTKPKVAALAYRLPHLAVTSFFKLPLKIAQTEKEASLYPEHQELMEFSKSKGWKVKVWDSTTELEIYTGKVAKKELGK